MLDYRQEKTFADSVQYIQLGEISEFTQSKTTPPRKFPKPDQLKFYYGKHGSALTMHHHEGEQPYSFQLIPPRAVRLTARWLTQLRLIADEMTSGNQHPPFCNA